MHLRCNCVIVEELQMQGPIKLASSARGKELAGYYAGKYRHFENAASLMGGDGGWDHLQQNGISDQIWTDVFIHVERLWIGWEEAKMDGWPPLWDGASCPECWRGHKRKRVREGGRLGSQWGETFPWNTSWWVSPTKGGVTQSALLQNSLVSVWIRPCSAQRGAQVNGSWMLINWCHILQCAMEMWRVGEAGRTAIWGWKCVFVGALQICKSQTISAYPNFDS